MQKFLTKIGHSEPLVYTMPLASLVGTLSRFSSNYPAIIVTKSENQLLVAKAGKVATTRLDGDPEVWRLETAARAIVAWLHHPTKVFEAITNSVI
jgi:hypothetical protein